ncbi:MAG: biotin--[acetyl-CoA-carboxylase] ligase [Limnobacter sp.]|nr:biotin--[acetyl-CoA-carboxylase] ligase [Limnobacter sp.]
MVTQPLHWIELDSVESTNTWLSDLCKSAVALQPIAVYAKAQTAGRGRNGRAWLSQSDSSLCMSVAVPLLHAPAPRSTVAVGVSVANFLKSVGLHGVQLKWPNDLLLQGKKLGGILCESVFASNPAYQPVTDTCAHECYSTVGGRQAQTRSAWLVAGIGLNVKPVPCADALGGAGSIALDSGLPPSVLCSLPALGRALAEILVADIRADNFAQVRHQFHGLDAWFNQEVCFESAQGMVCGVGMGLSETGGYLVDTPQGLHVVEYGEVSLRRRCG